MLGSTFALAYFLCPLIGSFFLLLGDIRGQILGVLDALAGRQRSGVQSRLTLQILPLFWQRMEQTSVPKKGWLGQRYLRTILACLR